MHESLLSARRKAVRHITDMHTLVAGRRRPAEPLGRISHRRMLEATHHEIAVCAYCIWQQEGRPEGRALDHWLQAELQLVLSSILDKEEEENALATNGGGVSSEPSDVSYPTKKNLRAMRPSKRRVADDLRI